MRRRSLLGLSAMFTLVGSIVSASSASAFQVMDAASVTSLRSVDVAVAETTVAPCPTDALVGGPLPKLGADLRAGLAGYAEDPANASDEGWLDSGGPFGGGVPAPAVRTLMRRGLAAGLTDEQVQAFLQPGFLRGMNDPRGGAWLFDFIGEQDDPAFLEQLASYAAALDGRYVSPTSAQADVFEALPLLRAAYMSQAAAIPPDLVTAEQMLTLANQGYVPAQETVQAFLAAGNHPSAGAQNAGGVGTGMLDSVYDYFVATYAGPLSPEAAAAMANRGAYNAWVDRIATWDGSGADMDRLPEVAEFSDPGAFTASSGSASGAASAAC